jgi:hypothetical protein
MEVSAEKFIAELQTWPVEKLLGSEIGWVRIFKIEIEDLKQSGDAATFTACVHYDELETTSCTNPPLTSAMIRRVKMRWDGNAIIK